MSDPIDTWTVKVDADTRSLEDSLKTATGAGKQFSAALTTAFAGAAVQGKGLSGVFDTLALSLSKIALKAASKPIENALSGMFANLLAGGASGGGFAFANGGVIDRGVPVPFASGGVISSPVSFPMAGGQTGLAGENGPEAIMPLTRGSDGKLGVKTDGGSGLVVHFNVTSPDADSFRRTESQIAAMLSRAVAQGQRNL
jgi:phage-related minor tail protein